MCCSLDPVASRSGQINGKLCLMVFTCQNFTVLLHYYILIETFVVIDCAGNRTAAEDDQKMPTD